MHEENGIGPGRSAHEAPQYGGCDVKGDVAHDHMGVRRQAVSQEVVIDDGDSGVKHATQRLCQLGIDLHDSEGPSCAE